MAFPRVGVLCGGFGAERDVSFRTADFVVETLRRDGCDAQPLYADRDLDRSLRQIEPEAAFVALHGRSGEEGSVQGLLESLRLPYTGPLLGACALAGCKPVAKAVLRQHNIPVAPHYLVGPDDLAAVDERHGAFGLPAVVKPATGGLSLGVSVVSDAADLEAACFGALRLSEAAIVERFVAGREIAVALLGGRALGAIEVEPRGEFWDFRAKAGARAAEYRAPRLGIERMAGLRRLAERSAAALRLHGAALCSIMAGVDDVVIGVTALPPIAPDAPLALAAAEAGLSAADLVLSLLRDARLGGHAARSDRRQQSAPAPCRERRSGVEPH